MEQAFIARREGGPDVLAMRDAIPCGSRRDGSGMGGESDRHHRSAKALPRQLPHVQLAALRHFGGPGVAQVRIVRPDDHPRLAARCSRKRRSVIERVGHVTVAQGSTTRRRRRTSCGSRLRRPVTTRAFCSATK